MNRKPTAAPAFGHTWVKVVSGPDKGKWIQVLKPEYRNRDS